MFEINQSGQLKGARIKVIGVGGSGCNAVNTMIKMGLDGVQFITANTDIQALDASLAGTKISIGNEVTRGLGAGANPEMGRKAALEDYAKISEILHGADMVFITAGMGGGTGTGAAPIFAKVAKEIGALTVGVVTKPFMFEGRKRMKVALQGLADLQENVDSLITIPNQKLLEISGTTLSMLDAFKKADEVLLNAVQGLSDLINHNGLINSDFADVKTIMKNKGLSLMGIGYASGEHRAVEAVTNAISSPLLEDVSINGATGIIINITGGPDLKIHEVNEATTLIMEAAHEDAEIIFGTVIDESMADRIKITVIATGLGQVMGLPKASESFTRPVSSASAVAASQASEKLEIRIPASTGPSFLPPEPTAEMKATFAARTAPTGASAEAVAPPVENPPQMQTAQTSASAATNGVSELARARAIAQKLGITNLNDDEYDIPTYLRRQQEREQEM